MIQAKFHPAWTTAPSQLISHSQQPPFDGHDWDILEQLEARTALWKNADSMYMEKACPNHGMNHPLSLQCGPYLAAFDMNPISLKL